MITLFEKLGKMSAEIEYEVRPKEAMKKKRALQSSTNVFLTSRTFDIQDRIGSGSYGDVFRSYSAKFRKDVAIKVIKKPQVSEEYLMKFFPQELCIIKHLQHQNIIKHLQTIERKDVIYQMFELARTDLLEFIMENGGGVGERRACRWFHHLVDGVSYIHNQGVAHRDLKTENLLIDDHGILKITDFGFSRYCLPASPTPTDVFEKCGMKLLCTTYCGTLSYSAPEVLENIPYDPFSSDVWSMGVILYVMLYGFLPFDSDSYSRLLCQVKQPVDFRQPTEISQKCLQLIQKILTPLEQRIYIPGIQVDEWYINMWNKEYQIEIENAMARQQKDNTVINYNYYYRDSDKLNEETTVLSNMNIPKTDERCLPLERGNEGHRLQVYNKEKDPLKNEYIGISSKYPDEREKFVEGSHRKRWSIIENLTRTVQNWKNKFRAWRGERKQISGTFEFRNVQKRKRTTQHEDSSNVGKHPNEKSVFFMRKKKQRLEEAESANELTNNSKRKPTYKRNFIFF